MAKKALLLTLGAGYICTQISKVNRVNITENLKVYEGKEGSENIGIFITDKGLCDSMILLQINKKKGRINVASFLKNCFVNDKKIGRVYNKDGVLKTIAFLNESFDLSINNYVKVDYTIIEKVIDKLGGITLELTDNEVEGKNYKKIDGNKYVLTGRAGIEYLKEKTIRKESKAKKQKRVVNSINKLILGGAISEFLSVISDVIPQVETSLKTRELVGLGISCLKIGTDKINKNKFPLKDDVKKAWVVSEVGFICDVGATKEKLHSFLNGEEIPEGTLEFN
ncbi:MAG: LCP family protein [Clostridium sp.]